VSFSAGWVEGPDGPVLADTKTQRRHVVDLDAATVEVISAHRAVVEVLSIGEEFVFSDDGGVTAWKPNRVTKAFGRHRRAAGLRSFSACVGCSRSYCDRAPIASDSRRTGVSRSAQDGVLSRATHRPAVSALRAGRFPRPVEPLAPCPVFRTQGWGGVLLAAFEARRPTRDIDLAALDAMAWLVSHRGGGVIGAPAGCRI
jgi:hypothetical protein